ncbi:hypothetical protein LCM19_06770 [Qipengyuania flava]|nr:hypothetical protein [Qipengyuania flava]
MTTASPRKSRKRLFLALLLALLIGVPMLATSSSPWVDEKRAATGDQVAAAKDLAQQARSSRETGKPVILTLGNTELAALSAMATQGAAPARIHARVEDGTLTLTGSRPILWRWLNIRARARGTSEGMPGWNIEVGSIPLPGWLSDWGLEQLQERYLGAETALPPLDKILRELAISRETVAAKVLMPKESLLVQAAATGRATLDEDAIAALYCDLVQMQVAEPEASLAAHIRRALAASEASPEGHRTAIMALALITATPEKVHLAAGNQALDACSPPANMAPILLRGRADWAMHWTLSAALEMTTGNRLGTLIGEWKELADTKAGVAMLAPEDPSGFSFVDLASDRAGLFTARRLTERLTLAKTRAKLMRGDENALLPADALKLSDGLTDAEFAARYGALDDPRYAAKVKEIDAMLRRGGIE